MQNAKGDGRTIEATCSGVQRSDKRSHSGRDAQRGQKEYRAESRVEFVAEGLPGPGNAERGVQGNRSCAQTAVRAARERGQNRAGGRDEA